MDGGQSVASEFQRLTAQISSQLAGLNKPNDGAAAAAIAAQRRQAQVAIGLQKEVSSAFTASQTTRTTATKTGEAERRTVERAALADIKRFERERLQIATQNEKAIEGLAKREADARIREARRAANGFLASLRDIQREEQRLRASVAQRASGGTNAFLAGAVGGITALVGVSAVSEIRQAGQAWLDYSNKLQTTKIAFTTMLGSAQLAEDHLKELQQFALKTPFQFGELIDASQRMQALGFNAQQVIPVLTDVGNAVAAAGGGSERLDRVVLALSQIQSKGKVMTQELNQLAEAGIPAFRILQETLNKSGAEVRKLVEDGKISSKVFLDAFQKFSQQNFGGLMEAQSKTFSGAMSNIKDALLQTSATAFAPLFEKLSRLAVSFSQAATSSQDFQNKLKTVGSVTSTIFDGMVEVILAFRDAIRLMVAAVTAQFDLLIGSTQAVAHALAAAFFEGMALGRVLRGDLTGASRAHQEAQNQLRISAEGAKKAFESQGKVIKELGRIYGEAEQRARKLREEQERTFTAGAGEALKGAVGAGTFRKKKPEDEFGDPTSTKGPDPAATEKRLAELRLANDLARLNDEEDQLKRSLARREILFTRYSESVVAKERERHERVIAGLEEERQAAERLRKTNQQQIQLQDIANKVQAENIRHKNEADKLTDETEANKRKQAEATTTVLRNNIETILRISAIGDEQRTQAIKAQAEARVQSEEDAERAILKIRLAAIDREKERIDNEITNTKSIQDPEEQLKAERKLNNDLKVLKAERTAIEQDGARDVAAAQKQDLENTRRYANELRDIQRQIVDVERDINVQILRSMIDHFASRKAIIKQRLQNDIEDENARHRNAEQGIDALREENRESNRTQQEKLEQEREIHRLEQQELRLHSLKKAEIEAEAKRAQRDAEGIFVPGLQLPNIEEGAGIIATVTAGLKAAFEELKTVGLDAFSSLGQAVGSMAQNYVLLGTTGPAALRKLLAATLAQIAAESAVKAIYWTAQGIADLFWNPARAGADFAAAALFASIAGVSALAGRAAAGDLFTQKSASTGGLSSSQGSGQLNPLVLGRNQPQVQVIRHEHTFHVVSNDSHIVKVVSKDLQTAGSLREFALNDALT